MTEILDVGSSTSWQYADYLNLLPSHWKYEVCKHSYFGENPKKLEITMKIALFSIEDIKHWIKKLEKNINCNYSVRSSLKGTGDKLHFKQTLNCHHNTNRRKTHDTTLKRRVRNTNCPSRLIVSLKTIKKKFRGKPCNATDPEMPCVIDFIMTHNHNINSSETLNFKRVSESTNNKLLKLYSEGHSAASALQSLKMEIQLTNDNYEELLADRSIYPDYNHAYYIYNNEFKKQCVPDDSEYADKTVLMYIQKYNEEMGEECAKISTNGSEYTIVLCPPLFKRVHATLKEASEILLMDSFSTVNQSANIVFMISTSSQCGDLPLGLIITSSETPQNLEMGFHLLQDILGDSIFYKSKGGPQAFMIDDSEAEYNALKCVYNKTQCLLCIFQVLQSVWRWLTASKNGISKENAIVLYRQFKDIMYASTVAKCESAFETAIETAKEFPGYSICLDTFWQRREMWALSYRGDLIKGNNANNYSETDMYLQKQKIFSRLKTFNTIQLVDFLVTKLVDYYKKRLVSASDKRLLAKPVQLPIKINQIQKLDDDIYLVPSEKRDNLLFLVNLDILVCTCIAGNTGRFCKHIDWLYEAFYSKKEEKTLDEDMRKTFFTIAFGTIDCNLLPEIHGNYESEEATDFELTKRNEAIEYDES